MNKPVMRILLFVILLALQVLILNNINVFGFVNPYLYISFIVLYPHKENQYELLSLSFLLGLGIDFFADSGGINASASLCIAYIRPIIFEKIFQKTREEALLFNLNEESFGKIFNYVVILTLLHHFVLFSLINFGVHNLLKILINTAFSSIFTIVLFLLGNFIFSRNNTNEA